MQQLLRIEKMFHVYFLDLFLLFYLIQSEESIHKSPRLTFTYGICNTSVEPN